MEAGCQCIMQCIRNKSYASFVPRAIAYLIDTICVAIAGGAIFGVIKAMNIEALNKGILFEYSIIAIATYIFKKFYFIAMTASQGQTLGKMCFRIKLVSTYGSKLSIFDVIYRENIGRYLSEVAIFLGYLGVLISEQKKGLHDWLCDTCVVYDEYINNEKVYYIPPKPNYDMYSNNGMTPMMYNMNGVNQASPIMNNMNDLNQPSPMMNNVNDLNQGSSSISNDADLTNESEDALKTDEQASIENDNVDLFYDNNENEE